MPWSQAELLFHEILHLKEPLNGLLADFHFGTEQGGAVKNHPVYSLFAQNNKCHSSKEEDYCLKVKKITFFSFKMNTRHMKWIVRLIPLKDIFKTFSFLCFNFACDLVVE